MPGILQMPTRGVWSITNWDDRAPETPFYGILIFKKEWY